MLSHDFLKITKPNQSLLGSISTTDTHASEKYQRLLKLQESLIFYVLSQEGGKSIDEVNRSAECNILLHTPKFSCDPQAKHQSILLCRTSTNTTLDTCKFSFNYSLNLHQVLPCTVYALIYQSAILASGSYKNFAETTLCKAFELLLCFCYSIILYQDSSSMVSALLYPLPVLRVINSTCCDAYLLLLSQPTQIIVSLNHQIYQSGVPERLSKEITALAPTTMKVKVVAPQERKILSLDRWFDLAISLSFLDPLDHQARIRRNWCKHRSQKMLLIVYQFQL